jgi:hypothetical protein
MFYVLRFLGVFLAFIILGATIISGEKVVQKAGGADSGFVLRANQVTATDGEPVLLKLTLIYTGDKSLRVDCPLDGLCQPGNGRPPWVWIDAPAGWNVRPEAFRDAFPEVDNSLHSATVDLKRGTQFETTISLDWRFRQIPLGRSKIRVRWPVFGDTFAPNCSPRPIATPTVTVPVVLNPRTVRQDRNDTNKLARRR